MKKTPLCLALLLAGQAVAGNIAHKQTQQPTWVMEDLIYESRVPAVGTVKLRAGYMRESTTAPFKGCILYLEGLGDSMRNHDPYFTALSNAGYRVVAFDYMGQGGSEGSMNNTRIVDRIIPALTLARIAEQLWLRYEVYDDAVTGNTCYESKKIVIGWSVGGLAAYEMANRHWADAVVLIAPGLYTKKFIGESAKDGKILLSGKPVITERTLTRNSFSGQVNPHVDPIKPNNPIKSPFFTTNLLYSSGLSRRWVIQPEVKGILFASGVEDTYVKTDAIIDKIQKNAAHFKVVKFEGALHELDNEMPEVSAQVRQETLDFLASLG
jgi:pimeloyl-ACP methyl ester carboxylesterase